MPNITRFEEIRAWQTARELTQEIYRVSNAGAFARDFGLRDQMRRAAVSIMSNIAEGFESDTQAQFIRYLGLAKASAGELRAQLYVASDVGYLVKFEFDTLFALAEQVSGQLSRFVSYLKGQSQTYVREEGEDYDVGRLEC